MRATLFGALALFGPGAALAQEMAGDPAAGAEIFAGPCSSCHVIKNEAGEVLAGNGDRNLYGVAGRVPGSVPDLFYSNLMRAYGESGAVWEEENFVAYVPDPTGFLQKATGLGGPSAMPSGVIRDEQDAHDLWAYLSSFPPSGGEAGAPAPAGGDAASTEDAPGAE